MRPVANRQLGHYIVTRYGVERVQAYIPPPLPPEPPLELTRLQLALEEANEAELGLVVLKALM